MEADYYENIDFQIRSPDDLNIDELRKRNTSRIVNFSGLSDVDLKNLRLLEIGGPLVEEAFGNIVTPPKLILDPLFAWSPKCAEPNKSCHRVRSMGEYLPLSDNSIDLVLCVNTIDHTCSPYDVLNEIKRVLTAKGLLIILCNIFPLWTTPFIPLFNIIDQPHPHHFTLPIFKRLLNQRFHIESVTLDHRPYRLSIDQNLKNNIAAVIGVGLFNFHCTPRNG